MYPYESKTITSRIYSHTLCPCATTMAYLDKEYFDFKCITKKYVTKDCIYHNILENNIFSYVYYLKWGAGAPTVGNEATQLT